MSNFYCFICLFKLIKLFKNELVAPEVNLKIVSGNKILKEEDVISLMCHTRATPEIQSYKWYVGENYLSGVEGASLNLKLRKEMHHKSVTCEATNSVASVKASIQLNILCKLFEIQFNPFVFTNFNI